MTVSATSMHIIKETKVNCAGHKKRLAVSCTKGRMTVSLITYGYKSTYIILITISRACILERFFLNDVIPVYEIYAFCVSVCL